MVDRMLLLLLFACGSSSGSPDAASDDAPSTEDVPVVDAEPLPDGRLVDSGEDAARPECGVCAADAPWRCDQCLDVRLQEITAVVRDERIWVVGGFDGDGRVVPAVRVYDPAADRWSMGPPLPAPRHHVQLADVGGTLVVAGGMRDLGFTPLRSVFVLRPGADAWQEAADMPRARAAGTGGVVQAALGNRMVIAGGQGEGRSDDESLDDGRVVFLYDVGADAWTEGAAMPTSREHCAGFVFEDELWVLGGRPISLEPTQSTVEIYDPVGDAWRAGPAMPTPHGGFAATLVEGLAVVAGGEERSRALDVVELLDLNTMRWATGPNLPTRRHGHAMAAVGERVYVLGGADEPIFAAVDVVESFVPSL